MRDTPINLPLDFDAEYYGRIHADLRGMKSAELEDHYRKLGIKEGRPGSSAATRDGFLKLLPKGGQILEIGPFDDPVATGKHVKYFDVLTTEALKQRAVAHGRSPRKCPKIDFVSENGDLSVVNSQFDAVVSSHAIEHQPDLVQHLRDVANVLRTGGRYFVLAPDKRYCFDHFIAESTIAGVLDANVRGIQLHDAARVIEHRACTTHNDPMRHWLGDHGAPVYKTSICAIRSGLDFYLNNQNTYIDTHAWQFTPASFHEITQLLFDLGMVQLQPVRVYDTVFGSNEFYAVLEKSAEFVDRSYQNLPAGFDERLYLLANPDVAAAGQSGKVHYLTYGHLERRKLRP